jgi:hypothetical protein
MTIACAFVLLSSLANVSMGQAVDVEVPYWKLAPEPLPPNAKSIAVVSVTSAKSRKHHEIKSRQLKLSETGAETLTQMLSQDPYLLMREVDVTNPFDLQQFWSAMGRKVDPRRIGNDAKVDVAITFKVDLDVDNKIGEDTGKKLKKKGWDILRPHIPGGRHIPRSREETRETHYSGHVTISIKANDTKTGRQLASHMHNYDLPDITEEFDKSRPQIPPSYDDYLENNVQTHIDHFVAQICHQNRTKLLRVEASPDPNCSKAIDLLQNSQFYDAIEVLKAVVSNNPSDHKAQYALAVTHHSGDEYTQAEAAYRAAKNAGAQDEVDWALDAIKTAKRLDPRSSAVTHVEPSPRPNAGTRTPNTPSQTITVEGDDTGPTRKVAIARARTKALQSVFDTPPTKADKERFASYRNPNSNLIRNILLVMAEELVDFSSAEATRGAGGEYYAQVEASVSMDQLRDFWTRFDNFIKVRGLPHVMVVINETIKGRPVGEYNSQVAIAISQLLNESGIGNVISPEAFDEDLAIRIRQATSENDFARVQSLLDDKGIDLVISGTANSHGPRGRNKRCSATITVRGWKKPFNREIFAHNTPPSMQSIVPSGPDAAQEALRVIGAEVARNVVDSLIFNWATEAFQGGTVMVVVRHLDGAHKNAIVEQLRTIPGVSSVRLQTFNPRLNVPRAEFEIQTGLDEPALESAISAHSFGSFKLVFRNPEAGRLVFDVEE